MNCTTFMVFKWANVLPQKAIRHCSDSNERCSHEWDYSTEATPTATEHWWHKSVGMNLWSVSCNWMNNIQPLKVCKVERTFDITWYDDNLPTLFGSLALMIHTHWELLSYWIGKLGDVNVPEGPCKFEPHVFTAAESEKIRNWKHCYSSYSKKIEYLWPNSRHHHYLKVKTYKL